MSFDDDYQDPDYYYPFVGEAGDFEVYLFKIYLQFILKFKIYFKFISNLF
jgi:hypothetical protein